MLKRISWVLAIILVLALASGTWMNVSAEEAVVPFKAYYPVIAEVVFDPTCGCNLQTFTPGGNGKATHMGLSLIYGEAQAWLGETIIQKGTGTLTAANGDSLTIYYEGTGAVIDAGQHIITDGWYVVTGGSGRFEGMTGGGVYHVFVYTSGEKPNDLWFEGDLHK